MKTITGSEKQVAWAGDIRADYIAKLDRLTEVAKELQAVKPITEVSKHNGRTTVFRNYRWAASDEAMLSSLTKFEPKSPADGTPSKIATPDILDYVNGIIENLTNALENKTEAKFWIEAR